MLEDQHQEQTPPMPGRLQLGSVQYFANRCAHPCLQYHRVWIISLEPQCPYIQTRLCTKWHITDHYLLHETNRDYVPSLAGWNTPPDIRHVAQMAKLTTATGENTHHLLHHLISATISHGPQRLKSRCLFNRYTAHLLADDFNPNVARIDHINESPPLIFSSWPEQSQSLPSRAHLPHNEWVRLNCFHIVATCQVWNCPSWHVATMLGKAKVCHLHMWSSDSDNEPHSDVIFQI